MLISVGYRVKSRQGTQFRIWATERLREYLVKGFAMDDARLKNLGGGTYWTDTLQNVGTCRYLPTNRNISAGTDLGRHGLGRRRQARLLVGLDADLPVEHPAAELQELGPDPLAAPAFQGGFADAPAGG